MLLQDIHIRDPYILPEGHTYYLYGTRGQDTWGEGRGFDVYVSSDLTEWQGPVEIFRRTPDFWADRNYWAPEVYRYGGAYYMFASFKSAAQCRGTAVLKSESPLGPFVPYSDGPVTPANWECLDGTLYISKKNIPYMVFCREWVQVGDGEIWAVELSEDLKKAVGAPLYLFKGPDAPWTHKNRERYITDGAFLYRSDRLYMLWSGVTDAGYVQGISVSDNGELTGRWIHSERLLFDRNGGHGMVFQGFNGKQYYTCHCPNDFPNERPVIQELKSGWEGIAFY